MREVKRYFVQTKESLDNLELYKGWYPLTGLVYIETYWHPDCGGCEQSLEIKDLLREGNVLAYLDTGFGCEYPADDPYKYVPDLKYEAIDSPMQVIEIRGKYEDVIKFKQTKRFIDLAKEATTIIESDCCYDVGDFLYTCYLLKFSKDAGTKIVPIAEVPAVLNDTSASAFL